MSVTTSNVKIVQCTTFRWNSWTTNWIRHVWSRRALILGHGVHSIHAMILYKKTICTTHLQWHM